MSNAHARLEVDDRIHCSGVGIAVDLVVQELAELLQELGGIVERIFGFFAKLSGYPEKGQKRVRQIRVAPGDVRRVFPITKAYKTFFKYKRNRWIVH